MRAAYQMSGLSPEDISFIECHATGTPLGDATELRSMARIFQGRHDLPVSSLKANTGHLITASGAAGIIKILAAMKHRQLPGNLYADEALWGARLHYLTPTKRLSAAKVRELLAEVRAVFHKALGEGGTSFDSQYVNVNGQAGYFAHSLHAYGRQGTPCDRCGSIIRREPFMNRSSHRCPSCQRTPRNR